MSRPQGGPGLHDLDDLLSETRAGSRPARERLFWLLRAEARHHAVALLGVRRRLRGLDASDLAQEAMQRLFRGLDEFRGRHSGELRVYMQRILVNCHRQLLRAAGRQKRDERATVSLEELGSGPPADDARVSQLVSRKQDRQRLFGAILLLPPAQRQALWLHYEGRRVAEIAQALGRTEKAVASLLARNVRALGEELRRADQEAPGPEEAARESAFLRYLHALERDARTDPERFLADQRDEVPGLRQLLQGLTWLGEQLRLEEQEG